MKVSNFMGRAVFGFFMTVAKQSWIESCEKGEPDFKDYLSFAYWKTCNMIMKTRKTIDEAFIDLYAIDIMEEILNA